MMEFHSLLAICSALIIFRTVVHSIRTRISFQHYSQSLKVQLQFPVFGSGAERSLSSYAVSLSDRLYSSELSLALVLKYAATEPRRHQCTVKLAIIKLLEFYFIQIQTRLPIQFSKWMSYHLVDTRILKISVIDSASETPFIVYK